MPIIFGTTASGGDNFFSPQPPTIGTATDVGTSRAYNNGAATVTFTPATSGGKPSTYTATSNPGSYTGSASSSPITVTGLQSATAYTYTVTATDSEGTSAPSSATGAVTATTVPQAPTIGTATDGGTGTTVSVAFSANATGGSSITGYSVVSSPTTTTQSASSSPYTFTGLTAGTSYTFQVAATNANGTSSYSSTSNSVAPIVPSSFYSIATVTAAGGETSLTFSSIPSSYKSLRIRGVYRDTSTSAPATTSPQFRFNSDSGSNYSSLYTISQNSTATLGGGGGPGGSTAGILETNFTSYTNTSSIFSPVMLDVVDYSSTSKYKVVKTFAGWDTNTNGVYYGEITLSSTTWASTAAVTSWTINAIGTGFVAGSTFTVYGEK